MMIKGGHTTLIAQNAIRRKFTNQCRRPTSVICCHFFSSSSSSSSSTSSSTDEEMKDLLKHKAKKNNTQNENENNKKPQVLFPWVHNPNLPDGNEEFPYPCVFGTIKSTRHMNIFTNVMGIMFLGHPWYEVLSSNAWKEELASSSSWALSQGVAGIISNVYNVPFDNVYKDGSGEEEEKDEEDDQQFGIDFQYNPSSSSTTITSPATKVSSDNENEITQQQQQNKNNNNTTSETETDEKEDKDKDKNDKGNNNIIFSKDVIESMFESKLRKLYESSHKHGKNILSIHLQMKPMNATLYAIYGMPFLSRPSVEEKQSRWEDYINMLVDLNNNTGGLSAANRITNFIHDFKNYADQTFMDRGCLETTIVALVCVECEEQFCVQEKKNDNNDVYDTTEPPIVIQGYSDLKSRKVQHWVQLERNITVRFEHQNTVQENMYYDYGNWMISDIDGLLHGNPFQKN